MNIDIITLFPSMFEGLFATSMLKKAQDNGLAKINLVDLRQYGLGKHKQVDDTLYGGGDGMLLRVDVVVPAIEQVKQKVNSNMQKVILLTPQGQAYQQSIALRLAKQEHLILVCGHYEGFDERIRKYVDLELSIGNYILTGGEIPAMVVADSVVRLIPGVLGGENSAADESFSEGNNIEYPHYTRPDEFRGDKVPEVLKSGDHAKIKAWRQAQSVRRTARRGRT